EYFADLPVVSTYHCRLRTFTPEDAKGFVAFVGRKVSKNAPEEVRLCILDGTGFSFEDCYPMQFYRGEEIRKIQSHVKIEVIAGVFAQRRFIIAAAPGPPYASEVKLVEPLLPNIPPDIPVLADKAYDCIRIIESLIANNCTPVIAIK